MNRQQPYILIMAGGAGTRFWPASREHIPKQFLDITGSGKSLLQATFDRFAHFIPKENIFIITHEQYKDQVLQTLTEMNPENVMTEPSRNNTAAAIALASFKLMKLHPEGICIVAPADHIIQKEEEFQRVLSLAVEHAQKHQSMITLGMKPTRPDTGYGYIEFEKRSKSEVSKVKSFREKPDLKTADQFIESGNFVWNSGVFIWQLADIMEAYKKYSPQIYSILSAGFEFYNTAHENEFLKKEYPFTETISIDYAILEKADNVYTILCDIGWSDLGTWNSLYDISPRDDHQNAILSKPVYLELTRNSLILSKDSKLVVIKGLDDFIVVDTDDCLLIYPKSEEQEIKSLKEKLKSMGLDNYL